MKKFMLVGCLCLFTLFAVDVQAQCRGGRCGRGRVYAAQPTTTTTPVTPIPLTIENGEAVPVEMDESSEAALVDGSSAEIPSIAEPLTGNADTVTEANESSLPEVTAPQKLRRMRRVCSSNGCYYVYVDESPCANGKCPATGQHTQATRSLLGATKTVTKDVTEEDGVKTTTTTTKREGPRREVEKTKVVIEGSGTEFESRVLAVLNQTRMSAGLPPLEWDETLAVGCRQHSSWLNSGGWGHAGGCTECIAKSTGSAESVAKMWLNSPSHRAIIMSSGARTVGIGCMGQGHTLRTGR